MSLQCCSSGEIRQFPPKMPHIRNPSNRETQILRYLGEQIQIEIWLQFNDLNLYRRIRVHRLGGFGASSIFSGIYHTLATCLSRDIEAEVFLLVLAMFPNYPHSLRIHNTKATRTFQAFHAHLEEADTLLQIVIHDCIKRTTYDYTHLASEREPLPKECKCPKAIE